MDFVLKDLLTFFLLNLIFFFSIWRQVFRNFMKSMFGFQPKKAVSIVVVVWRLHYMNTLKQELCGAKYQWTSTETYGISLTLCCFVWFILRGDLLYVFPCVILFLWFSVLLVLRLPRLGKRELILVVFARLFGLCLFGHVGFLFILGSGKGCGLWLWHSLDFYLTLFFYNSEL